MTAAVIGGLSDLWDNGWVKIAALVVIGGAVPFWMLGMAYAALQASIGGGR